jgi:hypothetical protein
MTVYIQLTTAGTSIVSCGVYSDVDIPPYSVLHDTVLVANLITGVNVAVPDGTTIVRLIDTGVCGNSIDIEIASGTGNVLYINNTSHTIELYNSTLSFVSIINSSIPVQFFNQLSFNNEYQNVYLCSINVLNQYVYKSDNQGNTFNPLTTLGLTSLLTFNIDKFLSKYLYLGINNYSMTGGEDYLLMSNNSGSTFTTISNYFIGRNGGALKGSPNNTFNSSLSYDGKYVLVGCSFMVGTQQYLSYMYSNDYGVTWNDISQTIMGGVSTGISEFVNSGAVISGNGKYMYIINNSGYYYKSDSYGVTWTRKFPTVMPYRTSNMLSCSLDGRFIIAASFSLSNIFVSNDYGETFTTVSLSTQLTHLSMSNSGKYVYFEKINTTRYISTNSGVTFTTSTNSLSNGKIVD